MKYLLVLTAHVVASIVALRIVDWLLPSFLASVVLFGAKIAFCILFTTFTFEFTRRRYLKDRVKTENKAVLITGCDTGFGHLLAKRLDSRGYRVFACCLFPKGTGASELKKSTSNSLQIIELDVTKDESVKRAEEIIQKSLGSCDLWAIVNNAGIHKGFSIEYTKLEDYKDCMNVNTFGHIRVIKAFLPYLRKSSGRIVNVTSLAGRIPMPNLTPYCISKFAATALSDSLRQELRPLGISVISIEPDAFQTPINDKNTILRNFDSTFVTPQGDNTGVPNGNFLRAIRKNVDLYLRSLSPDVHLVIDDLESAISLQHPECVYKTRQSVYSRIIMNTYEMMPSFVQDVFFKFTMFIVPYLPI